MKKILFLSLSLQFYFFAPVHFDQALSPCSLFSDSLSLKLQQKIEELEKALQNPEQLDFCLNQYQIPEEEEDPFEMMNFILSVLKGVKELKEGNEFPTVMRVCKKLQFTENMFYSKVRAYRLDLNRLGLLRVPRRLEITRFILGIFKETEALISKGEPWSIGLLEQKVFNFSRKLQTYQLSLEKLGFLYQSGDCLQPPSLAWIEEKVKMLKLFSYNSKESPDVLNQFLIRPILDYSLSDMQQKIDELERASHDLDLLDQKMAFYYKVEKLEEKINCAQAILMILKSMQDYHTDKPFEKITLQRVSRYLNRSASYIPNTVKRFNLNVWELGLPDYHVKLSEEVQEEESRFCSARFRQGIANLENLVSEAMLILKTMNQPLETQKIAAVLGVSHRELLHLVGRQRIETLKEEIRPEDKVNEKVILKKKALLLFKIMVVVSEILEEKYLPARGNVARRLEMGKGELLFLEELYQLDFSKAGICVSQARESCARELEILKNKIRGIENLNGETNILQLREIVRPYEKTNLSFDLSVEIAL